MGEAAIPCGPGTVVNCFFGAPGQRLMAVSYTATNNDGGDLFAVGKPRVWTETRLQELDHANYDLALGCNRRTAMSKDDVTAEKPPTHLTFLLNFFDKLRRRAPAGK
jgi:hypothetical protein